MTLSISASVMDRDAPVRFSRSKGTGTKSCSPRFAIRMRVLLGLGEVFLEWRFGSLERTSCLVTPICSRKYQASLGGARFASCR